MACPSPAPGASPRLTAIGSSFDAPDYVTAPAGDPHRIFVVEQTGRIRVVRDGSTLPTPFLDLTARISANAKGSERGLLSMAFAPDYARSGRFIVAFTDRRGTLNVVEFERSSNPDVATTSSGRVILRQAHPDTRHNGGLVDYGPDGLLYVGVGDGGGSYDPHGRRGNGQSLGTLLGKVLRIDPRPGHRRPYRIPATNPFVHRRGARPEIYAYGLRNPWRFSFDRMTGDLIIADVGQSHAEEIDFARRGRGRGANYGWRPFEGRRRVYPRERANGAVGPVLTYPHTGRRCAITGGYVVRDLALGGLVGQYLYGDFCTGQIRAVRLAERSAKQDHAVGLRVPALTSFGQDAAGRIYATSFFGAVYRLDPG
jgi:glucose/arabinose dehydrogenase